MAEVYGDPLQEHCHVRRAAGLIDLSYHGAILIGGKEGPQFLNGLVTNDVKALEKGKGMRAAFLTGHGKVRALCRVLSLGDQFLIITDPQTHDNIFAYVQPFTYAGDFKAEDVSDQYRILSVQGPKSLQVMKEVCFEPVPALEENSWIETIIAGHQVTVVRASHTGETGYDILIPSAGLADVWDFLLVKGAFHGIAPFGFRALDSLRIEAGIPVYGIDADENNMMLELGLDDAVSFKKGCYTGQEAVAMATYRGHISKKLSGLALEGDFVPARGDKISASVKDLGQVTSALASPTLGKVIAIGYIKYGFFEVGKQVEVKTAGGAVAATIVEMPFYKNVR
jgi:folate-binding protein YgfZ